MTTWSKYDCRWSGLSFFTLAELVRPKAEARFVYFTGYDGYSTNAALEGFSEDIRFFPSARTDVDDRRCKYGQSLPSPAPKQLWTKHYPKAP